MTTDTTLLREAADLIDRAGIPNDMLYISWTGTGSIDLKIWTQFGTLPTDDEEFDFEVDSDAWYRDQAAKFRRRIGGEFTKINTGQGLALLRRLETDNGRISVEIRLPQSACRQVKVGEREVVRKVEVRPAQVVEQTVVEDVYEWDCGPVLAAETV